MTAFHLDPGVVVDVRRAFPPTRESWDWGHARGSLETMEKQNVSSKRCQDARFPEGVGTQDRVCHDVDVRCVPAHSRDCGHVRSQQGARKTQNASWESRGRRVVGLQGEGGTRRCWCRIAATCAVRGGAVGEEWYVFCSSGLAYGFESSTLVHARPEWLD